MSPDIVATHLLNGQPRIAQAAAVQLLAEAEDPNIRAGLVRATVALAHPREVPAALADLPAEAPLHRVAHALAALASGQPSRGRALLVDSQDDDVLSLLTHSELTRACGADAQALTLAGAARQAAESTADPRWIARAELQLARCMADVGDTQTGRALATRAHLGFEACCPQTVLEAESLDVAGALARKDADPLAAIALHEQALRIWEAAAGSDSALSASSRYSLAQALHRSGDFQRALTEMQRSFLVTSRAFGPDHLDTWITRFELGRLEVDNGEMIDGFPRMEAARAEVAKRLGAQHPVVRAMDRLL